MFYANVLCYTIFFIEKAENYQELADSIMNFVFENYPDYKIPLLTQTMFNRSKHMAYTGFVMEVQPPLGDYRLVFTDSYRKQGNEINKRIEEYPTAHRCTNGRFILMILL